PPGGATASPPAATRSPNLAPPGIPRPAGLLSRPPGELPLVSAVAGTAAFLLLLSPHTTGTPIQAPALAPTGLPLQ
ncbi:MAG: hypothetical protein ABSA03_17465, partial [Streptosporangiaceae bacterium]